MGLVLVALALLVRIVVPGGYMAAATANGAPAIVICTGHGPLQVAVDAHGVTHNAPLDDNQPNKSDPSGDHHPCAFAGAATPLEAPLLALAAAPAVAEAALVTLLPAHQRPGLGLAAPPPPTTGPPALA
ncbi:hypothetical protein [Phenylobacterium sp.]|uniref:hypothetical protein n=1 Tax=Phenylobacterium sp. TaxID=1871053 RepID=UPI0035AFDBD6